MPVDWSWYYVYQALPHKQSTQRRSKFSVSVVHNNLKVLQSLKKSWLICPTTLCHMLHTTQHHNSEDHTLNNPCHKNLRNKLRKPTTEICTTNLHKGTYPRLEEWCPKTAYVWTHTETTQSYTELAPLSASSTKILITCHHHNRTPLIASTDTHYHFQHYHIETSM